MKQRILLGTCGALCAAMLGTGPIAAQNADDKRMEETAAAAAQGHLALGVIPGMTIAAARDGGTLFVHGYGDADVEAGMPAGPETVYHITSLSKQFTAALIMRLAEQGKLALNDPITKFLPDYPVQGHQVTIRHLLNHTSGIRDYSYEHPESPQWHRLDLSYEEMLEMWANEPFESEPGETYAYNNFGYYLLGEIVGRVSGSSYARHLESELRAHGLDQTFFCDATRVIRKRAGSYDRDNGRLTNFPYHSMHVFGGAAALCSTAGDLLHWTRLLHEGTFISAASLREMTSPTVLASGDTINYGYGFRLDQLGGHRKVFHGGTRPGGAYLAHYPERGLTIAVLTNSAGVGRQKAAEIEEALARASLGMSVPDLFPTIDTRPYEGTYTLQMGTRTFDMRVYEENGHLRAQPAGQDVMLLVPQGGHAFLNYENSDMRLEFTIVNGRAETVTVRQGQQSMPGTRKN